MITNAHEVKLIDLGYITINQRNQLLKSRVGTETYMAPEIIAQKPYLGSAIDIFSLGVTIFAARTAKYPFVSATDTDNCYRVLQSMPDLFWSKYKTKYNISDDFIDLINSMLKALPSLRPTIVDVIGSKWMNGKVPSPENFKRKFQKKFS